MGDGLSVPFCFIGEIMNNIFDAHAHYDDDWFDEDRHELLSSLPSKGVSGIVNASVDLKTAEIAKSFAEKYDYMYFTVGFHPENLEDMPDDYLDKIA
ncbi:MAG: TatD family hydrolase, partial [Ruminococcus sp.]|nr:TatD family hydrolase [Ruminococcus sp.]